MSKEQKKRVFDPKICDGVDSNDIINRERSRQTRVLNEKKKMDFFSRAKSQATSLLSALIVTKDIAPHLSIQNKKDLRMMLESVDKMIADLKKMIDVCDAVVVNFSDPVADLACLGKKK